MSKKILVLCGSPRKHGNTDLLCNEFIRGVIEVGHKPEKIIIKDLDIKGCIGCGSCRVNGGNCVQKDDMEDIYEKIYVSDVIVIASPIYFYTWTSQIKAVIDRTFAIEQNIINKIFYLISTGAAPSEDYMITMKNSFEQYVSCFRAGGNTIGGSVFAVSTNKPGDVIGTDAIIQAYEMGKNIK